MMAGEVVFATEQDLEDFANKFARNIPGRLSSGWRVTSVPAKQHLPGA